MYHGFVMNLKAQKKIGFGFVSDLELGQHVLWLCDELEN